MNVNMVNCAVHVQNTYMPLKVANSNNLRGLKGLVTMVSRQFQDYNIIACISSILLPVNPAFQEPL